jgi:hypothetical protein
MYNTEEDISVVASFGHPYLIRPVRFNWDGRVREVRDVTYRWQSTEGRARRYHFAVTDGTNVYELRFDATSLAWKLTGVDEADAAPA